MSREEKVAAVEAYLRGLANKYLSRVTFAADVRFEGPLTSKVTGRDAVVGFLIDWMIMALPRGDKTPPCWTMTP